MAAKRPNLLVFLTDDHAQWAARCYGNSELETPGLDFLAATGTRMAQAYTPCPVCSPARASFWTGRLPSQHGVHDWIKEINYPQPWLQGETTLAPLLKACGYQTALVGKWHCGQSWVPQPGFDYYLGQNRDQYPHKGVCRFTQNGVPVAFRGQRSAFVTEHALRFLRTRDPARPFFLCVGYVDTHSPFKDHPERLAQRYRPATFRDIPRETYAGPGRILHPPPAEEPVRREWLAQYYAAVSYIDEQVGALLDELEGRGDLADTLVVYLSDHGHMNGHHGLYTKGNATVPQNFYEESIRVPCLLRWPGHIRAGYVDPTPVNHCDLFETLLEAAGGAGQPRPAAIRSYPGRSYLSRLQGNRPGAWRDAWFCEYGNARMIRTDRYKYVRRYPPHAAVYPDELYDLGADPRETANRVAEPGLKGTIESLRERLDAFFQDYESPGRSGTSVAALPVYNGGECWRTKK